jgi:CubicO group peptidase (beta-lactamase class C family)
VRIVILLAVVVAAASAWYPPVRAQSLTFSLFERYLEPLREQAGIPGLSALISQDGRVAWQGSFGRQNVESSAATTFETAYPIAGLSQIFGSTLLLKKCVDEGNALVTDRVVRWDSTYPDVTTSLQALLIHAAPGGGFLYSPTRFAGLTGAIEQCGGDKYGRLAADEIFNRLGMMSTVPGHAMTPAEAARFSPAELARYADVLRRMAAPYRLDSRGRPTRSEAAPAGLDAATGVVTTANDLQRFDAAVDDGVLLEASTRAAAWSRKSSGGVLLPTGHGWFVQNLEGQLVVWQFGVVPNAYSSMILKVPSRRATLILLANSDGLTAPFALESGDLSRSLFAQLFLRLLVP